MLNDQKPPSLAETLAEHYTRACETCVSSAEVMPLFRALKPGKSAPDFGYKNDASLKAAVSKVLKRSGFSKSDFTRELVMRSCEKFIGQEASKTALQQMIQQDLAQHGLQIKHIRDILQEQGHTRTPTFGLPEFAVFRQCIEAGHSYPHAIDMARPSVHTEKKLRHWFINEHGGYELETRKARRHERKHRYLSLKDELRLPRLGDDRKADIWTAIGFIFADGAVNHLGVQIVITESDSAYLRDHVLASLLDDALPGNTGPDLILAHSVHHDTSYAGSRPVARLHIEDSLMAAFIQELGMPANKTGQGLESGPPSARWMTGSSTASCAGSSTATAASRAAPAMAPVCTLISTCTARPSANRSSGRSGAARASR